MKTRKLARRTLLDTDIGDSFVRGFISAGLLAGIVKPGMAPAPRRVLRLALQGGVALSAGAATLAALRRDSPGGALASVTAGAATLMAIEHLLPEETTEEK